MAMQAPIMWAQRKERVLATVQLLDVENPVLKIEGTKFTFKGRSQGNDYQCEVDLFAEVDEKESHYVVRARGIELSLMKKDQSIWWPRLVKAEGRLRWITADWNRWRDSSDSEGEDNDFKWDPSEMGNFGSDDSDGEEPEMEDVQPEEEEKPKAE